MTDQESQKSEISLSAIQSFLDGLRPLVSTGSLAQISKNFSSMRDHLTALKKESLAEDLIAAPEFNVFRLLGLSRAEVRTHSAMLASLFNSKATHGQQFLFLKSFLEYCHLKDPGFPHPSGNMDSAHWDVYSEYRTASDRRLDIVVRSPDLGYMVVIENKVDAWEQTDQLKRYARWLESQRRDYPEQGLVFLTIQGSRAYTAHGVSNLPLSYHDDIYSWLASNMKHIQAQNVRAIIAQYVALVHVYKRRGIIGRRSCSK